MGGNEGELAWWVELQAELEILWWLFWVMVGLRFLDAVIWKDGLGKHYGIRPRREFSLLRLCLSPFLHINRYHLIGNAIPLLTLGWLVMQPDGDAFWVVTVVVVVVGGIGIWLFGATKSYHLGSSGLALGYFGFLLSRGIFERNGVMIAAASFIMLVYQGLISEIVPKRPGVSATGHFFGFIGGIVAAWLWVAMQNRA